MLEPTRCAAATSPVRCYALIPAAGAGQRAGTQMPKQYAQILGQTILARTLTAFAAVPNLAGTLVVLAADDTWFEALLPEFTGVGRWTARCGGATRGQTVLAGLQALLERGAAEDDWVLVHDAARCLIQPQWVERLMQACLHDPIGGLLALPLADTLKSGHDGRSLSTIDRSEKWVAQTPQMFRIGMLREALLAAGTNVTDEASAIELAGRAPLLVSGDPRNLKITWPQDFELANQLLGGGTPSSAAALSTEGVTRPMNPKVRIGEGWDTHALVTGRPLILGGVAIPHTHGLLGHSDADALLHAITDALLGAAGLGDIGRHFPDTDARYRGADSSVLLANVASCVREAGWQIGNVDGTIVAQAPKMAPHIAAMRERIAQVLGLALEQVNVKAKTAEKMGPVGEGRAIESRAVCLLFKD